jgi:hypothetical protein
MNTVPASAWAPLKTLPPLPSQKAFNEYRSDYSNRIRSDTLMCIYVNTHPDIGNPVSLPYLEIF